MLACMNLRDEINRQQALIQDIGLLKRILETRTAKVGETRKTGEIRRLLAEKEAEFEKAWN